MTAQEKAKDLYEKFGKNLAIFCVSEIEHALINNGGGWDAKFWDDVKEELYKL